MTGPQAPTRHPGLVGLGPGSDTRGVHPDLLPPDEAAHYLRLDRVCPTATAARDLLNRMCQRGQITPFQWAQERLFHRAILDAFVASELAAITTPSASEAEGNGAV